MSGTSFGYLLVIFITFLGTSSQQVIISSLAGRAACSGEDVNLTCSLDPGSGRLTWIIGSTDNTILYNLGNSSTLTTQTDSTGQFTAYLIHYTRDDPPFEFLGNITSTLHTRVDPSLNIYPISIRCYNGLNLSASIPYIVHVSDPPSPPLNMTVEVVYDVSEYSLIVQWNSPRDDGGVEIDNYTLSVYNEDDEVLEKEMVSLSQKPLLLNYSVNYSLTLTVNNCAGTSSPVSLTSMEAGCRAPLAAVCVIIEEYNSTEEGAVIQFHCQNGYHPTEWVTSQCINSSWSPDLVCFICNQTTISSVTTLGTSVPISTAQPKPNSVDSISRVIAGLVTGIIILLILVIFVIVIVVIWRRNYVKTIRKKQDIPGNDYSEMPLTPRPERTTNIEIGSHRRRAVGEVIQNVATTTEVMSTSLQSQTEREMEQEDNNEVSVSLSSNFTHSVLPNSRALTYAQVNPIISAIPPPKLLNSEKVTYVTVWGDAIVPPLPSESKRPADIGVSLDQILIQLQQITPDWRRLAVALKIDGIEQIKKFVSSDKEAMVEVVDSWLKKLYPTVPTWKEIADIVEEIGYSDLAFSLKQVYVTGYLPVEVSHSVSTSVQEPVTPPPLPPRQCTSSPLPPRQGTLDSLLTSPQASPHQQHSTTPPTSEIPPIPSHYTHTLLNTNKDCSPFPPPIPEKPKSNH